MEQLYLLYCTIYYYCGFYVCLVAVAALFFILSRLPLSVLCACVTRFLSSYVTLYLLAYDIRTQSFKIFETSAVHDQVIFLKNSTLFLQIQQTRVCVKYTQPYPDIQLNLAYFE